MSATLETFFLQLTPLQQAARAKISAYRDELAVYGIFIGSADELEFITQDKRGAPLPNSVVTLPVMQYLQRTLFPGDPQRQRCIEKLAYESTHTQGGFYLCGQPVVPYQYELNISEPSEHGEQSAQFSPETVAGVTALLKEK